MGQSTEAILFYGLCWDEEAELWDRGRHDEWSVALAKRRGIISPWDFYTDSGAEAEHNNLPFDDQKKAYYYWKESVGFESMLEEWKSALAAIKAEHPEISVGSHCSCDYPMPYICIADTQKSASRGYPETFDPRGMAVNEDNINWRGPLAMFVEALDIDVSEAQGPGWFLVSNWC